MNYIQLVKLHVDKYGSYWVSKFESLSDLTPMCIIIAKRNTKKMQKLNLCQLSYGGHVWSWTLKLHKNIAKICCSNYTAKKLTSIWLPCTLFNSFNNNKYLTLLINFDFILLHCLQICRQILHISVKFLVNSSFICLLKMA